MPHDSWAEVKRLAADLQRAQLGDSVQRLTDSNCVEVVNKLVEMKLLTLTHTCDGKAYLTDLEIVKEIREELAMKRGRVSLCDLQTAINVDYSFIESHVVEMVRGDPSLTFILGQLLDRSYSEKVVERVSEVLLDKGQITFSELTRYYDLPASFIREILVEHQKANKDLVLDGDVLYTDKFIAYHKRVARGALSALTRPKSVAPIIDEYQLQGNLFSRVVNEIGPDLAGAVSGSDGKALYKPSIYARAQTSWVLAYFHENGYLEYELIRRLGISDPRAYIRKLQLGDNVILMKKCAVNKSLQDQISLVIDDAMKSTGWIDVQPYLPDSINKDDATAIIEAAVASKKDAFCFKSVVMSNSFLKKCRDFLGEKIDARARKEVKEFRSTSKHAVEAFEPSPSASSEPEGKKKGKGKASGGGAGSQGREVKTKSTKNKYRAADRMGTGGDGEKEGTPERGMIFMESEEMENLLLDLHPTVPADAMTSLVSAIESSLNKQYRDHIQELMSRPSGITTSDDWKKAQSALEEKINSVITKIRLFVKGIHVFPDDVQTILNKHLLNTLCSEVADVIFRNAEVNGIGLEADSFSSEQRAKILSSVSDKNLREKLTKLHQSLTTDADAFCEAIEEVCASDCLSIHIKKTDKKKERQIVHSHKMTLIEQLENESDPMLALHLCSIVLFITSSGLLLHAPGKCVPNIITYLSEKFDENQRELLTQYQKDVVKLVKTPSDELTSSLKDRLPQLKEVVKTFKKGA